jgi:DNA-binding LacI/PurR family transcriptional regulator
VAKRATIYDVAQLAGVSISTVSFALNRPERVSDETRRAVLAAADQLGFVPKAEAVSRARKGVGRIGVIAPFSSYPSFFRRLSGILGEAAGSGLDVCVYDEESTIGLESPLISTLPVSDRLDGLIVMARPPDAHVTDRLVRLGPPTVLLDVTLDSSPRAFSAVGIDDAAGGALAANYLLSKGHRRIWYLRERLTTTEPLRRELSEWQRLAGFEGALHKAGLDDSSLSVHEVATPLDRTRSIVRDLLNREDRPTAIFGHDALAAGALLAARDAGLRVPDDIAVMGFDDGDIAAAADLTTVRQPFEESGRMAMRTLSVHMGDPECARHTVILDLGVVERSSV